MQINLEDSTKQTLEQMYKNHPKSQMSRRAHSLLLKDNGFDIPTISQILSQGVSTIYRWFKGWTDNGLIGLYDKLGRGRKPILGAEDKEELGALIREEARKLDSHQTYFEKKKGTNISKRTLKRTLRSMGYSWKRMRKWLGDKRDENDFRAAVQELESLKGLEDKGLIDLYYCDESGFNLIPNVPYSWQKIGEESCLPSTKSPSYNVLGFMNRDSGVNAFGFQGTINAEVVVASVDAFCKQRQEEYAKKGRTPPVAYVIIDNAPIHNSKLFRAEEKKWEGMRIRIKRLPAYCPELNLIEILWRKIKYQWLPLEAYQSMENLMDNVDEVIRKTGSTFLINFG